MGPKVCFVLLLSLFSSTVNAEKLNHLLISPKAGGSLLGGLPGLGGPLTAKEVERSQGDWIIDIEGACSPEGCTYKNKKTGEKRLLPLKEKKLLEARTLEPATSELPAAPAPPGIVELPSVEAFNEQFNTDKKVLHFVFSAVDCGGCKVLKGQLNGLTLKENPVFTLTRPKYIEFKGHPAHEHEKFSKFVSSVPVLFRYTKQADGTWAPEKFIGGAIFKTLKDLN